jgi:hypothetical protein
VRRFIEIDGKRYAWKEILHLRREQSKTDRQTQQLTLFELRDDCRPASQQTADGRYQQPALFKVN